jgi:predicted deacetylase
LGLIFYLHDLIFEANFCYPRAMNTNEAQEVQWRQEYVAQRSDGTWWLEEWRGSGETHESKITMLEHRTDVADVEASDRDGEKLRAMFEAYDFLPYHHDSSDVFEDHGMEG